jgi:hypothetical protein
LYFRKIVIKIIEASTKHELFFKDLKKLRILKYLILAVVVAKAVDIFLLDLSVIGCICTINDEENFRPGYIQARCTGCH